MVKRFCDRCGKELGETWYQITTTARCNTDGKCTLVGAAHNLNVLFAPTPDYCEECAEEFRRFLEKK